ncbi:LRR receptor-like serine/threonine-protein kinase EFR [Vigna unguiculata]|uniref:non-specific serine/threonine protein kinase n=1 Tax=Vigna unguiculata TaxID=3917 RepID=A0A4D6LR30_VIGUN|nr:LRR receptor-like serine/threonine-protein kinase EFR [Vigna unguiculata]
MEVGEDGVEVEVIKKMGWSSKKPYPRTPLESYSHGILLFTFVTGMESHAIPSFKELKELNLEGHQLKGFLSPHIGNLSYMTNFSIMNNNFYGEIPQEVGRLSRLQKLYLGNNSFVGEIPTNLTGCAHLTILYLFGNNLIGKIPIQIGSLQKLQSLNVGKNSLNNLAGPFPYCLYNMSCLTEIDASINQFNGSLPPSMFHTLPNLRTFTIGGNEVSGPIPVSITNASMLSRLQISRNYFTGQVPSLGKLQYLSFLSLEKNNLGNNSINDLEFLKSLTNCSKLQILGLSANNFGGHLPNSMGNLSTQLTQLYLGGNRISGEIPASLGNLIGLNLLMIEQNSISGIIPTTFGKFQKMQKLSLGSNYLSGQIGAFIGNLSQLFFLGLEQNMLQGNIPPNIGNCQKLQELDLYQNNLTGTIPIEIFNLSSLTNFLDLTENSLSGSIPEEVGNLKHVDFLSLSNNYLSGHIPSTIGECIMLEYLYLEGNSLQGIIPSSLASLKSLRVLDMSQNHLSGSIPNSLQNIHFLEYFNVSFNMLDGEIPTEGVFRNASALGVAGNSKLCGGISELHLPPCPVKAKKLEKHHMFRLYAIIVSAVVFLLILSVMLTICRMRKGNKKPSLDSPRIDQLAKVSFQSLHNGTNGFSTTNLIGSGNFSSVYRGTLDLEDKVVAIKVLNLQRKGAHKSFIVECNALKNVRHRNLVKILTCCSSTDYKGQDFKALVFEYMRNGSLEQWLHPRTLNTEHSRTLSLDQRLNIMIDIASALHYLHHEYEQSIIHCDLKPSNVLLDDDMVAHVGDFGIARLLNINSTTSKQATSTGIKGTVGYAPPEYGVGSEVSTHGDMYSFGILMLEMFTGRRPTDETFEGGQNLHSFVKNSFPNNVLQILDPSLVAKPEQATIEEENTQNLTTTIEKHFISVIRIGLACSLESPNERMNIVDVTRELNKIKRLFLLSGKTNGK